MATPVKYPLIQSVIIDFDSVICSIESMDLLFDSLLSGSSQEERESTLGWVKEITNRGMAGEIPFSEALQKRLDLLPKIPAPLDEVAKAIGDRLSRSFLDNLARWNPSAITVVSSGFRQLIEPALLSIGISAERIYCNELSLDSGGIITGVNPSNPLAGDDGKSALVRSLDLPKEIAMIGDGFTDLQVSDSGAADYFFAYIEFARRETIVAKADEVLNNFDRLAELVSLNRY